MHLNKDSDENIPEKKAVKKTMDLTGKSEKETERGNVVGETEMPSKSEITKNKEDLVREGKKEAIKEELKSEVEKEKESKTEKERESKTEDIKQETKTQEGKAQDLKQEVVREDIKNELKKENQEDMEKDKEVSGSNSVKDEDSKPEQPTANNKVLFDSMVENERKTVREILERKVYGEPTIYGHSNVCLNFCFWLGTQCTTVEYKNPSSTLLGDLEFIQSHCNEKDLFVKEGDKDKLRKYMDNIQFANPEILDDESLDMHALACACRNVIKTEIVFFNERLANKLTELYRNDRKMDERRFAIERAPFLMNYRTVFKLIKDIIRKLDHNKMTNRGKSIEIWADLICDLELPKEQRMEVLTDLLSVEYDHIPIEFYVE